MNCNVIIDRSKTGERLRRIFNEKKITYENVAEMIGLTSPRVIYDWISGIKLPSLNNLVKLSMLLDFKLEDVLVIETSFIFLNHQYIAKIKKLHYNQDNHMILTKNRIGCIISMQGITSSDRKQCLRSVFLTTPIGQFRSQILISTEWCSSALRLIL